MRLKIATRRPKMLEVVRSKLSSRKLWAALAAVVAAAAGYTSWSEAADIVLVWLAGQSLVDAVSASHRPPRDTK
jgi:hypothetical protein